MAGDSVVIEVKDLCKRFAGFTALDHLNFRVERGEVAGFLGLNGAGKTTAMRIISCYMPPTSGFVKVGGNDTVRQSDEVRRLIGYLPERVPLYDDLRVDEYLRFRARLKGVAAKETKAAVSEVISRCGLESKRRSMIRTLSKGFRQRVGLADALVHKPQLLVLDEPTSGLDPDQRVAMRQLIVEMREERSVLLSTHILPEAEAVCDRVIIVHRGIIRASDHLDAMREGMTSVSLRYSGSPLQDHRAATDLEVATDGDGNASLKLDCLDRASQLAGEALAAGRKLLEIKKETPSLERIFIKITTGKEEAA